MKAFVEISKALLDGIDEMTQRHLSGIATHNDVILFLVFDPISERIERPWKST